MKTGAIKTTVRGKPAVDGAGVHLVRVLGFDDVYDFDPFLMLDSFDSTNPEDYTAGFPLHPHRGIETVTYLIEGEIEHSDTLGNKGTIHAGEAQWMTAGSGIKHSEFPKASPRMLGFQLWLNLPQQEKMASPSYLAISSEDMPTVRLESATVRVLSGSYGSATGTKTLHIQATLLDISLQPGKSIELPMSPDETTFVFLIEGNAIIAGEAIAEKTAVLLNALEAQDTLSVLAQEGQALRLFFFAAKPLKEPIAWGGPIVMNTKEELDQAFEELKQGTFIKAGHLT